jgi:F-type H+-transporting ATPase subunit b
MLRTTPKFRLACRPAIALAMAVLAPAAAHAAEQKEGMPQLNFANPLTLSQVFWMGVIFLVLYLVVKSWGLPQVARVVDARNASITRDLDKAKQAKAEADAAVEELTAVTKRSHAEAQAEIAEALAKAKREAAAEAEALNRRLDAELAGAERQIAEARGKAMGALGDVATDTARALLGRLLGVGVDDQMIGQAVAGAIAVRDRG